jgi:hypothetical protein
VPKKCQTGLARFNGQPALRMEFLSKKAPLEKNKIPVDKGAGVS